MIAQAKQNNYNDLRSTCLVCTIHALFQPRSHQHGRLRPGTTRSAILRTRSTQFLCEVWDICPSTCLPGEPIPCYIRCPGQFHGGLRTPRWQSILAL